VSAVGVRSRNPKRSAAGQRICYPERRRLEMKERTEHDLTGVSFNEYVDFIFDKPVPQAHETEKWYWNVDIVFSPDEIANHYIQLFTEPVFLLSRFLKPELEEGFWAIQSGNLGCDVSHIIWHQYLPFATRENCVRSMFHLFERLFAIEPMETAANMWWDSLCYGWHCGNRLRSNGGDDQRMQDVMLETLSQILHLQSLSCQVDALHGVGHLHHPDTEEIIRRYSIEIPIWIQRRKPTPWRRLNSACCEHLAKKEKANLISQTGLYLCRQRPTLPHTFACSTIGPAGLNFRVRDGNGWSPRGKITDKS
jgi:hypothetical protein